MKKVKICGLTRAQDVSLAVSLGADWLGFVLASSPRSVDLPHLRKLVRAVPATVLTTAVVVNASVEDVDAALQVVDRVQFHGDESPEFCARYGRRGVKAFRIRRAEDLGNVSRYEKAVGAYLLDSFKQGQPGGTGHVFPWSYLAQVRFARPTFLAGGLNASNVALAMAVTSVDGLDLSSGLESEPGRKDDLKMTTFFEEMRRA